MVEFHSHLGLILLQFFYPFPQHQQQQQQQLQLQQQQRQQQLQQHRPQLQLYRFGKILCQGCTGRSRLISKYQLLMFILTCNHFYSYNMKISFGISPIFF